MPHIASIGSRWGDLRESDGYNHYAAQTGLEGRGQVMLDSDPAQQMTVATISRVLEARVLAGEEQLTKEVSAACGADLMSDVMAFVKEDVVLLTGLMNPQVIRTADLLDIKVLVFVRGKCPSEGLLAQARENSMVVLATRYSMFLACGRLYEAGLRAGGVREIA